MDRSALITGITGQDGSYLAELLLAKGYKVFGLVRRLSTPNTSRIEHILDQVTLLTGDLLDQSSLSLAIDMACPDEIYNLAAMSHVGESFHQPCAAGEYNGLGVVRLLEAIRQSGGDIRFYQASTSELFGNAEESPQNEQTPFHPVSPYSIAKLYSHLAVAQYRRSYGLHASCGILFNHESPRRGLDFVTRKITSGVARIKAGLQDKIELGTLTPYRDWGFAGDYVKAMWLMLQQEQPDDYVVATGIAHRISDFVATAVHYAGLPKYWTEYVEYNPLLERPNDVSCLRGEAQKAKHKLGWKSDVSFNELVAMMVQSDLRRVQHERDSYRTVSGVR